MASIFASVAYPNAVLVLLSVKCPVIDIPNGVVVNHVKGSPREVVFNTVVQITCIRGFKLNGANQLHCGADGSWMPNVPTCERVKCPITEVPNGIVGSNVKGSPHEVVFGTVVLITCIRGFKLNGANQLRCGADGFWTPNVPTCEPVKCPVIDIPNGTAAKNNARGSPREVVFNTVVQITCSPGFKLIGAQELRCGADGSWTPAVPTCEPMKCPVIDLPNGQASPSEGVFDTIVQITCSPGFKLIGVQELRCGADGSWTPAVPTCEPVTCPVIDIINGQASPQEVVFDTVVQITCSPGFKLIGVQELRCGADGSWTPAIPNCEPVRCSDIEMPNGQASPSEGVFDTVVQITCSPGFKLIGAQELRCGADGSWTPAVPTCEPVTCPVIDIINGQSSPSEGVFDTVVQITCSPGFKLIGAQDLRCGADGSWTPAVPTCEPVACPVIDIINGQSSPSEGVFDTVVQITCSPGFKLIGVQELRCGADGSWTPASPTCEPMTCPAIDVTNGQVSPQEVVFDSVVHITCSPGFNLIGTQELRCGADGSWTPAIPTCEPVTCPVVDILNGQSSPSEGVFDTVVQITCSPGFKLNGAQELRCGADGSWTPAIPTCEPVTCPVVDIPNGQSSPSEGVFDTVVQITCSPGFKLNGAQELRCGADGSWTPAIPTCEPMTCPVIDVTNGQVSPQEVVVDSVVQITCSPGFKLNGAQELHCGADGSWTPAVPTCEPVTWSTEFNVSCPVIEVTNGQVSSQGSVFNTSVQITCSPGFQLNGAQELLCGIDGSWTPNVPTCEPTKMCSPLSTLQNGQYVQEGQLVGDQATAVCNDGYVLRGHGVRVCLDSGWSGTNPTCEVKCPVIDIKNGMVVTNAKGSSREAVFNTMVQITCYSGFKRNGANQLRCGPDGSWTPSVPTCEPVTCSTPVVDNGVINGEKPSYKPKDTVLIMCRRGFNMTGSPQVTCGLDGKWKALPMAQTKIPCGEPRKYQDKLLDNQRPLKSVIRNLDKVVYKCAPGYAQMGGSSTSFCIDGQWTPLNMQCERKICNTSRFEITLITCSPGFKLNGADLLRCGEDGSWTPNIPTCEPVTCPVIDMPNGQVSSSEVVFDTVVQITCSPGFKLNGENHLCCGADGFWTPNVPTCEPVTCPVIDVLNGRVSPQQVVFDTVQITCSPGFKLNGADQLRCEADGSWTPNVPTCEPVKCPVIDLPYGQAIPSAVAFDTSVQINCAPGFRLNGTNQLRCGADGSWTPSVPTCEQVKCPVIDIPNGMVVNHGKVSTQPHVENTVVHITCFRGFRLKGAIHLRCGADASWTPNVPTCEPEMGPRTNPKTL
ncbi:complement receptor type 2-like [Xyrauchen texanus]|uniref:complement receptor type 2-like n=1 Tax=Xyrauchen texanus TaxID=154827 RepID=UPI00224231D9|nr:complement receptor type 2-like [Xyrauchen texanus]